jgi:hypothetical protein
MARRGVTPDGGPVLPNGVRHLRREFARCVLPTPLLVESVIFASRATKALRMPVATGPCDLMKFRAIKLLKRKTAVSQITSVRDLIPPGSPALFVVCRGLAGSRFAASFAAICFAAI